MSDAAFGPSDEASIEAEDPADDKRLDLSDDMGETWRTMQYKATPSGLEIELDGGVRLLAMASPIRVGRSWGVAITLEANTKNRTQKLFTPKRGPMAFRGIVERAGKTRPFDDQRGGNEITMIGKEPITFSRDWPGKSGEKPLAEGETVTLKIGLWGITGMVHATPHPWEDLFVVRVGPVSSGPPDIVIDKPAPPKR